MHIRTAITLLARVVFLLLACRAAQATLPSDEEIAALLRDRVDRLHLDKGLVAGVVEPGGQRLVAYGSSGTSRPLAGDTLFQIGSLTKVFSTLLMMQMQQAGELEIDEPLSAFMTGFETAPGREATLRDLATHRSGLPSMPTNFDIRSRPDPYAAYQVRDLEAFLRDWRPGAAELPGWRYSNVGVAVLGHAIARRARMPFAALLTERVLRPLKLRDTTLRPTPAQLVRLARGHDRDLRPVETWELGALPASGGLRSSMRDLLRFLAAELGNFDHPLQSAMREQRQAVFQINQSVSQAIGWATVRVGGRDIVLHDGGKAGYRAVVALDVERGTAVALLSNTSSRARLDDLALQILTGRPAPAVAPASPRTRIALHPATLRAYAGTYRFEGRGTLRIVATQTALRIQEPGFGVGEFVPSSVARFFAPSADQWIEFEYLHGSAGVSAMLAEGARRTSGVRVSR